MSDPQFIVPPIQNQNSQPLQSNGAVNVSGNDEIQVQLAQSQRKNQETQQSQQQQKQVMAEKEAAQTPSLVRQVASDPRGLYSFINRENPSRTFATLITAISLIISTRYFSPVQWFLKIACIVLGATSLLELVGRISTKDGLIGRIRPRKYYRPSTQTPSRVFSELGEAVDMASVKIQKIIFAEDLRHTGIAFGVCFVAYWLVQIIPAFWLAITVTILTFILGPILTREDVGSNVRGMKPEIDRKVQDFKNRAADTATSATHRTANSAQNLGSQAMDTASSAADSASAMAQHVTGRTNATASQATNYASNTVQDLKNRTVGTTPNTFGQTSSEQTGNVAQDLKNRATDTASSATDRTANVTQDLKNRTMGAGKAADYGQGQTAGYGQGQTNGYGQAHTADYSQGLQSRPADTTYPPTNPFRDQAGVAEYPNVHETTVPNPASLYQDDLSRDRRI